ncbi:phosphatidate cytidylyltransferase [Alginatibacterium sediminis]|nr:phosphatidate cytidylyltransferase [Alginatibacterium sediminis]
MEEKLWLRFIFLFALGGVGVWFLSKDGTKEVKLTMRGKYSVYLLMSLVMFIASIYSDLYFLICLFICLVGLIEILALDLTNSMKISSISFFMILSCFFVYFGYISATYDATIVLCLVLALDGFSELFGKAFGKNAIAENISPNKSWEGFLGGYFSVMIGYLFLRQMDVNILGVLMITTIAIAALAGDLLASYLKRKSSVKDFSEFIPFHGGFLDRFDSLIVASAIAAPFYMMGVKI